jgi:hypothetical protein
VTVGVPLAVVMVVVVPEDGVVVVTVPVVVAPVPVVADPGADDGEAGAGVRSGAALVEEGSATDGTVTVARRTGWLALPIVTTVLARIVARTLAVCLPLTRREAP